MKKFFIFTIALGLMLGIPFSLGLLLFFSVPPSRPENVVEIITIPSGTNLNHVAQLLQARGVISSHLLFILLARWRAVDTQIKPGEYQLSHRMLPHEVLNKLIRGEQIRYSITSPEGLTLAQIACLFQKMKLADKNKFTQLATDPTFIASLGMDEKSLEGYLFPDTYKFFRGIGEKNIIRRMVQRFNKIYNGQFRRRAEELHLSRKEVITLASIVEKETADPKERPLISAVLYNRLKKNMRLQCDPTVIYGLEHFNGDLTRQGLETYTPYNTYLVNGLPPTPIGNPGKDSIQAALYPANVDYLYFVSKNDGTHCFSTTLPEHNYAVNEYQKPLGKEKCP